LSETFLGNAALKRLLSITAACAMYGLNTLSSSFLSPLKFLYYPYLWQRFWEAEGISNKLSVIFKGPGWTPGKPRLGDIADIPQV